ncbi:MAG: SpoIID/LytB domain-containing protein [Nitrospirota bacterium]|jgi:stage II sporulation protein D
MRAGILAIVLCAALAAPLYGADGIRVLIMDKGFGKVPAGKETLTKLDEVQGSLITASTSGYRGSFEVWRGPDGLYIINEVPLEEYVEGVVTAESGKDWAYEALKAQAVVVRTYALYQKMQGAKRTYDVTSSVLHQLFKGQNSDPAVAAAVRETRGQILVYDGEPIAAYYHSTSGGRTELPEEVFGRSYPYLTSVKTDCSLSPYSFWTRRIPITEIEKALGKNNILELSIKSNTATGRVKEVAVRGNPSTLVIEAKELRKKLGWKRLPSTDFTVKKEGDLMVFEGRGYGHGVGLCQWSALEMALKGKSYKDILSYFYPGTELVDRASVGF